MVVPRPPIRTHSGLLMCSRFRRSLGLYGSTCKLDNIMVQTTAKIGGLRLDTHIVIANVGVRHASC